MKNLGLFLVGLVVSLFILSYFGVVSLPLGSMLDDSHVQKTFRISAYETNGRGEESDSFSHAIPECSHVNYVTLSMEADSRNVDGYTCKNGYAEAFFNGNRLVVDCTGTDYPDTDQYSTTVLHKKIVPDDYMLDGSVAVRLKPYGISGTFNKGDTVSASVEVKVDYLIDSDCDGTPDKYSSHKYVSDSEESDPADAEDTKLSFFDGFVDFIIKFVSDLRGVLSE